MSDAQISTPTIALLFPGQGSQTVGMGRALYDAYPAARAVFDEADEALGFALSKIIFEGPEEDAQADRAHPARHPHHVHCGAAGAAAGACRTRPQRSVCRRALVGGVLRATSRAGTFSFADAVRTVRARGQFMQAAVPAGEGRHGRYPWSARRADQRHLREGLR